MKTVVNLQEILLLVSIIFLVFFNSCSLIGFGIGTAVDHSEPKVAYFQSSELHTINEGRRIEVQKKDGTIIVGRYDRFAEVMENSYAQSYNLFYQSHKGKMLLMPLKDTIKITYLETQVTMNGIFVGFDERNVFFNSGDHLQKYSVPIDSSFAKIEYKGIEIDYDETLKLLNDYSLPIKMSINVQSDYKTSHTIPLYDIKAVITRNKRRLKYIGFAAGLAVDMAIIIVSARSFHLSNPH